MIINITNGQVTRVESNFAALPGCRINEDITVTGAPTGSTTIINNYYDVYIIVDNPGETLNFEVLGVESSSNTTISYNNTVIGTIDYSNRRVELKCGGKKMRTDIVIEAGVPVAIYYPASPSDQSNILTSNVIGGPIVLACWEDVMKGRIIIEPASRTLIQ